MDNLNDSLANLSARFKAQSSGTGRLSSDYWYESTMNYFKKDNLCIVEVKGHLKALNAFSDYETGSGFPLSIGSNYGISTVFDNTGKIVGEFRVNADGSLSLSTKTAISDNTTVTGRFMYIMQ